LIYLSPHIAEALGTGQPVVALETAVVAHGLPHPINLELAIQAQEIIRQHGAHAATIGIVAGRPRVGLTPEEIEVFARQKGVVKTNISNLAWVITRQAWGATTVSASLKLAHRIGIKVLATGGIGGVHRNVEQTFDISSDLSVLAETPMMVVCSGAKAILDLPKTFEHLETLGVPVIGYQTDQFPAFFSRISGIALEMKASTLEEVIEVSQTHWAAGNRSGVIVAVPIPKESEIPQVQIEAAVSHALAEAERINIFGKDMTPFLLSEIEKVTAGRSLKANVDLILNNVRVAAELSQLWAQAEH